MRKTYYLGIVLGLVWMGMVTLGWAQPIKIGAVINLTGPASSFGVYHAKGHQDYCRYVNEVKGGVVGRKLELILVDHGYKVPEGIKWVKKFCEEGVDMISTWDTGTSLSAKPMIQEYKIPDLVYSLGPEILEPPVDYMYLPFGSFKMDCYALLEYIRTVHKGKDAPKVGLLTFNNAFGKTIHKPSKEYADKNNLNIVSIEEFTPATIDLTTELLRLKNKGVEYIFIQTLPAAIILALKAADRIDYKVPFFGTVTTTDQDFFKLGQGLIRDRLIMQFCGGLQIDGAPGVKLMQALWDRYKSVDKFDSSYWQGIVTGMIMERAFQRSHEKFGKINSENINKAMETFQNEDFGGLVPKVSYSKGNHEASFMARIVQVHEDATFTPLTNFFVPGKEKVEILKSK